MTPGHYKEVCETHGTIYAQCRCPSPDKALRKVPCHCTPDPRANAEDAYRAFIQMPESEWQGLLRSVLGGGVLTMPEMEGFERALRDRHHSEAPR